jgi:hypothetical protein
VVRNGGLGVLAPDYEAFVLGDLKTIKGDGIPWIEKDGSR